MSKKDYCGVCIEFTVWFVWFFFLFYTKFLIEIVFFNSCKLSKLIISYLRGTQLLDHCFSVSAGFSVGKKLIEPQPISSVKNFEDLTAPQVSFFNLMEPDAKF